MIERLIQLLQLIEANDDIKDYEHGVIPARHPDVIEAGNLADAELITSKGEVNWDAVDLLHDYGYSVFALEKDRFGWLVGGIATNKGTISFG